MRLTLPYVFEFDLVYRHGRKVHEGNFWDLVEVDITEVDDLPHVVVPGRPRDQCYLWNGTLVDLCRAGGVAVRSAQNLQVWLNGLLERPRPLNTRDVGHSMPAPLYMGSRRMGFIRNAFHASFQRYQGLPMAARQIVQDRRVVRWREAQIFYEQSLVSCQGYLYARVPEPVWHIRKLPGASAGYNIELKPRTTFLTAYREFRMDRINDAVEFICVGLESLISETYFPVDWDGAFDLRRSDTVELTKATIAAIDDPSLDDRNLTLLHSGAFNKDDEIQAASDAYSRVQMLIGAKPEVAQTPKMRTMAARWEFELEKHPDLVEAPELSTLNLDRE